ncbi:DUF1634 domain-containing protein [Lactobacillus sp. DCY120]|uniref:DUF1634 domain-containing protein n=1 Tax=Bombilactobacillus apium TaxID=2675299 RepID=A0A850R5C1_9LACO|nr:DUF1634 domain-containing protein [Bombilactobacillus apium]NVY97161.1 DUF1634 domain-containing protein [Bombilactobacillus apium]
MSKEELNEIELIIGKILRVGVIVSVIVMIIGLGLMVIQTPTGTTVHFPTTISGLVHGIGHFQAASIMMLGIFLLILTPVLRVVVSIYAFAKEKDYLYVIITTLVLVILAIAMIGGYWIAN